MYAVSLFINIYADSVSTFCFGGTTDCSAAKGPVTWLFSEEPIYSPVSSRVLGECNAITSPGFGRNGLTFVSTPAHHGRGHSLQPPSDCASGRYAKSRPCQQSARWTHRNESCNGSRRIQQSGPSWAIRASRMRQRWMEFFFDGSGKCIPPNNSPIERCSQGKQKKLSHVYLLG